jgi:hypothetical protein
MSAWSHLPNAHHIDQTIESVKENPEIWDASWLVARGAAWDAIWIAAWDAAWSAAYDAARGAAWDAAMDAAWDAARGAVWGTIAALITYDDASKYLEMPSDKLRVWSILSEDPAAVLLLPAIIAFESIAKKKKQELTI